MHLPDALDQKIILIMGHVAFCLKPYTVMKNLGPILKQNVYPLTAEKNKV